MEPVEINAGAYYLRALRADDRVDDRPALLAALAGRQGGPQLPEPAITSMAEAGAYVALRARQWQHDQRYTWVVAEPTTGELLGEVGLDRLDLAVGSAELQCWTHPAHRGRGVATRAVTSVARFGFGALGLVAVTAWHARDDLASARLAARCGFEPTADGAPQSYLLTAAGQGP